MARTGYAQVASDEPNPESGAHVPTPNSPPPSFRSRDSSPASSNRLTSRLPVGVSDDLADAFGSHDASDDEHDDSHDEYTRDGNSHADDGTQSLLPNRSRHQENAPNLLRPSSVDRRLQNATTRSGRGQTTATTGQSNDGVFANLNAKPELGEKLEEHPPSYEQAAADATPPYWETTLLAPGLVSDEVFIDGLPVGSLFSFVWNGIISMAFQLVGFLLTYLLHTTHAARNGSRAGLGVTLINYGFTMRRISAGSGRNSSPSPSPEPHYQAPAQPNSHDFDPAKAMPVAAAAASHQQPPDSLAAGEWFSYVLMIAGWIILIKAVTDYIRVRKHEQLILQRPDRGLNVPVVAGEETPDVIV